jgi:hypothetical protein
MEFELNFLTNRQCKTLKYFYFQLHIPVLKRALMHAHTMWRDRKDEREKLASMVKHAYDMLQVTKERSGKQRAYQDVEAPHNRKHNNTNLHVWGIEVHFTEFQNHNIITVFTNWDVRSKCTVMISFCLI